MKFSELLGDFISIQKNPDFKLSKPQEVRLNKSIIEEYVQYKEHQKELKKQGGGRRRFFSLRDNSKDETPAKKGALGRRQSAPVTVAPDFQPRQSLFNKLKFKMNPNRHSIYEETICEEEESSHNQTPPPRREVTSVLVHNGPHDISEATRNAARSAARVNALISLREKKNSC